MKETRKKITTYLAREAILYMRHHISAANQNEVFFVGKANEKGLVESVQVVARGNKAMVPAITHAVRPGDVVIHNHPSGGLEPSHADTGIASALGNEAVGFYIVNNDVRDIYVVVEPQRIKKLFRLSPERLVETVGADGPLPGLLDHYESRPPQVQMIEHVAQAFNQNKLSIIEAGTGTGKTMAYLIPAIEWSVRNGERTVVATGTINLQEQLIEKDIPLLEQALKTKFRAVLVKGRTNYACKRKLSEVRKQVSLFTDPAHAGELENIIRWAKKSPDGSKADLGILPNEQVWEKIQSESDTTLRTQCPFYNECFFYNARRRAAAADILIANHHIFFADLAVRTERGESSEIAVLPKYKRVILDEAHNIEDVASTYFGISVTYLGMLRALHRLFRIKNNQESGLLPFTMNRLHQYARKVTRSLIDSFFEQIVNQAQPKVLALEEQLQLLMEKIYVWGRHQSDYDFSEVKLRLTPRLTKDKIFKEILSKHLTSFLEAQRECLTALDKTVKLCDALEHYIGSEALSIAVDLSAPANRLLEMSNKLEQVLMNDDPEVVCWLELKASRYGNIVRLRSAPLDIAPVMKKNVFDAFPTVVMTSATLSIAKSFQFLEDRIGLNRLPADRRENALLDSPFDYNRQVLLAIPTDLPEPNQSSYASALKARLQRVLEISRGRAFVLFTSYSLLNKMYQELNPILAKKGIIVLRQGTEPRRILIDRFKKRIGSVLFGTDSFWQGVDVHGEALECVIIPRLPFRVPSEPIIAARVEAIDKRGGNSFMEYSLPQAVLKFKQGFGRLIRRQSDFGTIIVFDNRIAFKRYGKLFLDSLPECHITGGDSEKVYAELEAFYREKRRT